MLYPSLSSPPFVSFVYVPSPPFTGGSPRDPTNQIMAVMARMTRATQSTTPKAEKSRPRTPSTMMQMMIGNLHTPASKLPPMWVPLTTIEWPPRGPGENRTPISAMRMPYITTILQALLCPWRESNPHFILRTDAFYTLNYRGIIYYHYILLHFTKKSSAILRYTMTRRGDKKSMVC